MLSEIKILGQHGKQYIPDIRKAEVPSPFRGLPEITKGSDFPIPEDLCPTGAINTSLRTIDIGMCSFCGECEHRFPETIRFTNNHRTATNDRNALIITEDQRGSIELNPSLVRKEIIGVFGRSLKLRQVSAGGDNSAELELGACGNVNFDMGRFGIEFVASPRHADGVVVTGPISKNMSTALEICYTAVADPKLLILAGTDAISGGIFAGSPALDRSFLESHKVDLYVPGNPPHPLTFINGILDLIQSKKHQK
ncbi:MAG: hypothetical protein RIM99_08525 [Cyclobacteriaceae bacterium]